MTVRDLPYNYLYADSAAASNRTTLEIFAAGLGLEVGEEQEEGEVKHMYLFDTLLGNPAMNALRGQLRLPEQFKMGSGQLPKAAQVYLGGPLSGSPPHQHASAINVLAFGRKRW